MAMLLRRHPTYLGYAPPATSAPSTKAPSPEQSVLPVTDSAPVKTSTVPTPLFAPEIHTEPMTHVVPVIHVAKTE